MPVVRRAFSRGTSGHRVAFQRAPTNGATAARLGAGGFFTFDATSTDNGTSNTQASIQSNTDSGSGASATSTDIIPPAPGPAPGPLPGGGPPPPGPGVPPPGPNSPQQPTRPLANAPNPTSLLQQSSLSPSSPPTSSSVPFPTGSTTFSNVGGAPTSVSPLASSRTASGSGTNNVAGLIAGLLVLLLLLIIGAFFAIRRRKSRAGPPAASGDSGEPDSEATGARWQALEALPSLTFRGVAGIDSEWQSMAEKPLQPLRPGLLRLSDASLSTSRSPYGGTWNNDIDRGTRTTPVLPREPLAETENAEPSPLYLSPSPTPYLSPSSTLGPHSSRPRPLPLPSSRSIQTSLLAEASSSSPHGSLETLPAYSGGHHDEFSVV